MTTSDPRHYDVILSPVITEKATNASEHNKVIFKGRVGRQSDSKRAIVTLEEGQKIDVTTGL